MSAGVAAPGSRSSRYDWIRPSRVGTASAQLRWPSSIASASPTARASSSSHFEIACEISGNEAAQLAVKHAIDGKDPQRNLAIIKLRNAATVNEHVRHHGLGWFDLALLAQVERAFRELGLIKNQLDVQRLFTNELVQML